MLRKEVAEPDTSSIVDHSGGHAESIAAPEEVATDSEIGLQAKPEPGPEAAKQSAVDSSKMNGVAPDEKGLTEQGDHRGKEEASSQGTDMEHADGLEEPLLQGQHQVCICLCIFICLLYDLQF